MGKQFVKCAKTGTKATFTINNTGNKKKSKVSKEIDKSCEVQASDTNHRTFTTSSLKFSDNLRIASGAKAKCLTKICACLKSHQIITWRKISSNLWVRFSKHLHPLAMSRVRGATLKCQATSRIASHISLMIVIFPGRCRVRGRSLRLGGRERLTLILNLMIDRVSPSCRMKSKTITMTKNTWNSIKEYLKPLLTPKTLHSMTLKIRPTKQKVH